MDAGIDASVAGVDASVADAGHDAGVDAGTDAGVDAGTDAGVDAGTDAGVDAGTDAGIDAGTDAGMVAGVDAGTDAGMDAGTTPLTGFCALPGSWVANETTGTTPVSTTLTGSSPSCEGLAAGAACAIGSGVMGTCRTSVCSPGSTASCLACTTSDLSWMKIPPGYCVHPFGNVGNARKMRFAPDGDLFVASPTQGTTSGGQGGKNAILVLADDNADGYADAPYSTFLSELTETTGMAFANGMFYYQDYSCIRQVPFAGGERVSTGDPNPASPDVCIGGTGPMRDPTVYGSGIINITEYESGTHWPKAVDIADDNTIYVSNGGDQGEMCIEPSDDPSQMPYHGGIWQVDGTPNGKPIVKGLRNPIDLRCQAGFNTCYGLELALDYSSGQNGREKLYPIVAGENFGYPCCATANTHYTNAIAYQPIDGGFTVLGDGGIQPIDGGFTELGDGGIPNCTGIAPESASFVIGETPFGVEFDSAGILPAPYTNNAFVALHGYFGSWVGARVVTIKTDSSTGSPLAAADLDGGYTAALSDFATGWDDGSLSHGRPAAITMSDDGRLFLANDTNGDIVWFAPAQ